VPGLHEAIPQLESEAWTDPSPRNVMGLADAYRLSGRPEQAIDVLGPLLAEDASAISPRVLLAWCLRQSGREDEAAATLQTVRELDPANPYARVDRPAVRSEPPPPSGAAEGSPSPVRMTTPVPGSESEAEPERALTPEEMARIPPSPLYSATLAEIFERQGFEEKAVEIYEHLVRMHPERTDLAERIAALRSRPSPGPS